MIFVKVSYDARGGGGTVSRLEVMFGGLYFPWAVLVKLYNFPAVTLVSMRFSQFAAQGPRATQTSSNGREKSTKTKKNLSTLGTRRFASPRIFSAPGTWEMGRFRMRHGSI